MSRTLQLGVASALLLLAGILLIGLWRVADSVEHHAYNSDAVPPSTFQLTAGKTYLISTRDGKQIPNLQCTWSTADSPAQHLDVQPEGNGTRPTHAIAHFVAPAGGRVKIDCPGAGAVFVDDADNSTFDLAGLFLLGAVIALTAGVITGLSATYRRASSARTTDGPAAADSGRARSSPPR